MVTVYYARWILLPDGSIQENGAIAVDGHCVKAVGSRSSVRRASGDRAVNLGQLLLLPGLINLHTHLEEGIARGSLRTNGESFASYIMKKNTRMRQAAAADIENAVRLGVRESLAAGITTVVDSSQRWLSPRILAQEPIRSWVIHQVDSDTVEKERTVLEALRDHLLTLPDTPPYGIGPYALYSLSPDSLRTLIHVARSNGWRWASHVAESAEELQAFAELSGDLYSHITRNSPWQHGVNSQGPMYYAITNNLIPNDGICYHCNYVTGHELALLAAKQVSIGISTLYTEHQGHKPFPLETALKRGINMCAVTESLADTNAVNLFDELFSIRMRYPHIPSGQLIKMVTLNPARALGVSDRLGSLEPGKLADMIGLHLAAGPGSDILESLIQEEPVVNFVMVGGEEIIVNR